MSLLQTISGLFQKKQELRIPYHRDLGHGWLEVKISLLKELGIENQITPFSYLDTSGEIAFLEEDVDATLFMKRIKQEKRPYKFLRIDNGETSFIRSLKHYG